MVPWVPLSGLKTEVDVKLEILYLELLFFAQIFSLGNLKGTRFSVASFGAAPLLLKPWM